MATQASGIRCSKCSFSNIVGAKFCQNCGQLLGRACRSCGNLNTLEANFCNQCGTKFTTDLFDGYNNNLNRLQQSTPQALRDKIINAKARMEGERKPVAILFTDIVDSTSIAEKLDPEDWRDIITGAHQLVSQVVYRYEGTIAQLLGDGVLAFFGAPITHEDDPLRAVRAGLEIQEAIQVYQQNVKRLAPNFQMRVGINTGLVVVGNIGDDLHMEYQAIGDAVNLAARVQSLANPGKVLISESTYHGRSQFIECTDLGMVTVKGKAEPVHVYQVLHLKDATPNYLADKTDIPMVGREKELSQLQDLTAAVKAGIGRIAIISGEPGVGKSRLVSEWRATLESSEQIEIGWVEGHCLSYSQSIAYHLVNDSLRSMAGLAVTLNHADTLLALQKFIQDLLGENWVETYALLGHLLSLPLEQDVLVHIRGLDPVTLQAHYVTALQKILNAMAVQKPLVLLCEDLHWADPSSVEILIRLLPLTREVPLFFCFTSRPDQDTPGWQLILAAREKLGAGLAEIFLQPLSIAATNQMVSTLLAASELPEKVKQLVLNKSEGNPLFVEEIVRMLVERDALIRENDTWIIQKNLDLLEIPDNLKRLVLSRIDRLGEEPKRVLRVASVIGREFALKVLEQVYSNQDQDFKHGKMTAHLSLLEYANLIKLATVHPDLRYLFYHAVIQEAAYEAMLKADRRVLHRMVAETLEQIFPDRLDDLAATLGYHFGKGEVRDKAVIYLTQAAQQAQARYANQEAIGLYYSAIELVEQQIENSSQPEIWEEKLVALRESLGDIQYLVGHHHEARTNLKAAIVHSHIEDFLRLARLHRKMGSTWIPTHDWNEALKAYQTAEIALGQQQDENNLVWWQEWLQLQIDLMFLYYWENRPDEIKRLADNVRPIIEKYGSVAQRGGFYQGLVLANLRYERYRITEETLADMQAYLSVQKEVNNPGALGWNYFMQGFVRLWHHDLEIAHSSLQSALMLVRQTGDITVESRIVTYLTICCRMRGFVDDVRSLALESEDVAVRAGMLEYSATAQANLSWVCWWMGDFGEARIKALNALDQWQKVPVGHASCTFKWTALFPLLAMADLDKQIEETIEYCHTLLDSGQMRLPDPLEEVLNEVISCWEEKNNEEMLAKLHQAVESAKEYGYL